MAAVDHAASDRRVAPQPGVTRAFCTFRVSPGSRSFMIWNRLSPVSLTRQCLSLSSSCSDGLDNQQGGQPIDVLL